MKEYQVGETFLYKGKKLITVEDFSCVNCYFLYGGLCNFSPDFRACHHEIRKDKKSVIFVLQPFKFGK